MFSPSDIHQPDRDRPPAPPPHTEHTPTSDSGLSISSSSSGEIMGTPFDLGAQRFEYPFPQAQGSPTDSFLPLSSSITPHSHAQLPPWSIHISKSFPLAPPPLRKLKAHPKLRSASVREPPVPPGLVKRRSRLQHQSSSEEPSDRSDAGDDIARAQQPSHFSAGLAKPSPRHPLQLDDATFEIVPMKQTVSLPITPSAAPPSTEDPAGLAVVAGSAEATPRPQALQREREFDLARDQTRTFAVYCRIVASQLCRWIFYFLGWFSRA